jgi:hypothetical protein
LFEGGSVWAAQNYSHPRFACPPVTKTDCGRRSREKKSNGAANVVAVLNTGLNRNDEGVTICSTSRETNPATKAAIAFPFPVFISILDAGSCPSLPETACERLYQVLCHSISPQRAYSVPTSPLTALRRGLNSFAASRLAADSQTISFSRTRIAFPGEDRATGKTPPGGTWTVPASPPQAPGYCQVCLRDTNL